MLPGGPRGLKNIFFSTLENLGIGKKEKYMILEGKCMLIGENSYLLVDFSFFTFPLEKDKKIVFNITKK